MISISLESFLTLFLLILTLYVITLKLLIDLFIIEHKYNKLLKILKEKERN